VRRIDSLCGALTARAQLGDLHFVDATLQEAACAPSRLVVGCDAKQRVRLVRQEGELELEGDLLDRLLDTAARMAAELIATLNGPSHADEMQ
jgi:exosome complex RNA-binding protein Rrp42 (RNase PH superfamily)